MKYGFTTRPNYRVTVPGSHALQEQVLWLGSFDSPGTFNYEEKNFYSDSPIMEWNFSRSADALAFRLKYK